MCVDRLEGKIAWAMLEHHNSKETLYEGILQERNAHSDLKEVEGEGAVISMENDSENPSGQVAKERVLWNRARAMLRR